MSRTEVLLTSEDYGTDMTSVNSLLNTHLDIERELESLSLKVRLSSEEGERKRKRERAGISLPKGDTVFRRGIKKKKEWERERERVRELESLSLKVRLPSEEG